HLRPLGVSQNESVHPKLESQPSPDENPESQQTLAHHVRGERMAAGIAEERRLFGGRFQELLVLVIDVVAEVPFCWRTVKFGVCVPDRSTECGSIGLSWASSTSLCMRDK
ncbi:hypothetical protein, partial [Bradyrhizobium sp. 132]|uniref:hypothetical protein n=2 Tax=unclassified Bradyrhizobium TaxID=2631580 RepID=UPI001FF7D948